MKNIQHILDQSFISSVEEDMYTGIPSYVTEFSKEKFAELLIKECIQVARKADNEDSVYAWYAIEQHFGI